MNLIILRPGDEPDDEPMGRFVGALNALFAARDNPNASAEHLRALINVLETEWRELLKDTEEGVE